MPMTAQQLEQAIHDNADLSRGDFRACDFSEISLREAKLSGSDFSNCNLSCCDLYRTNLSGAILRGTNLTAASLHHTDLSNADLTGAIFKNVFVSTHTIFTNATGIYDAGMDYRAYRFLGIAGHPDGIMIHAGCRWFNVERARSHWTRKQNLDAIERVSRIVNHFNELDH